MTLSNPYVNASMVPNFSMQPEADTPAPGEPNPGKRRKRRQNQQYQAPVNTPTPITNTPSQPRGGTPGNAPGGGQAGTNSTTYRSGTDPGTYNADVNNVVYTAPKGSFAAGYPDVVANPDAAAMAAQNPIIIANDMMKQNYGLPAGSYTAGRLSQVLDPTQKYLGLGMDAPTNNIDWINLGASIMSLGQGPGYKGSLTGAGQLDPRAMMGNMVNTVMQEMAAVSKGGAGTSGTGYNPLRDLAHENPAQALQDFSTMVKGALSGTMPDDVLNGYMNHINIMGQQFIQEWAHSNSADMEAQGLSFISYLVGKLGPTLGL